MRESRERLIVNNPGFWGLIVSIVLFGGIIVSSYLTVTFAETKYILGYICLVLLDLVGLSIIYVGITNDSFRSEATKFWFSVSGVGILLFTAGIALAMNSLTPYNLRFGMIMGGAGALALGFLLSVDLETNN